MGCVESSRPLGRYLPQSSQKHGKLLWVADAVSL